MVLFLIVTLFKSALNIVILRFKELWTRAFQAGIMMSQSGEFSFLLAAAGLAMAAKSSEESKLIISVTVLGLVLSLALSPFWLATARPASARRGTAARDLEAGAQTNLCQ